MLTCKCRRISPSLLSKRTPKWIQKMLKTWLNSLTHHTLPKLPRATTLRNSNLKKHNKKHQSPFHNKRRDMKKTITITKLAYPRKLVILKFKQQCTLPNKWLRFILSPKLKKKKPVKKIKKNYSYISEE